MYSKVYSRLDKLFCSNTALEPRLVIRLQSTVNPKKSGSLLAHLSVARRTCRQFVSFKTRYGNLQILVQNANYRPASVFYKDSSKHICLCNDTAIKKTPLATAYLSPG